MGREDNVVECSVLLLIIIPPILSNPFDRSDIAKCNAKDEMNSMKEKKKACLAQFSKCKTAQDSAVEHTATCPSSQNTGVMTTNKAAKRNILQMFLEKNLLKRHQQNLARE